MGFYTSVDGQPRFFLAKKKRILAAIEGAGATLDLDLFLKLLDKHPEAIEFMNEDAAFREHFLATGSPEYIAILVERGLERPTRP